MIVLERFAIDSEPCEYLHDRTSRLEYAVVARMSPLEYETALHGGFRKFGLLLFRPACPSCRACRPLRIPADRFQPDRSQRRCLKRNADLRVEFAPPTVDAGRLDLFNRYHAAQQARKGWPETAKGPADYLASFVRNPVPSLEVSVWRDGTLRAVALTDITPQIVSGVYHYHDPEDADRGLGTFAMLQTIALAQRLQKPWVHFGYYVADCPSLNYKARFRPCQLLGEDGVWKDFA